MEITKMLTISTAHISEDTAKLLDKDQGTDCLGLSVYRKGRHGWFINVSADVVQYIDTCENIIPEELEKLIKFAVNLGCGMLCLDCDGEILSYFEVYLW